MKKHISFIVCLSMKSYALADNSNRNPLVYNGDSVVIIKGDSEMPEAMLRNIEKTKNAEHRRANKNQMYEEYLKTQRLLKASVNHRNGPDQTDAIISISLDVYQNPQDNDSYCGYACLQSVLEYWGIYKSQTQIAAEANESRPQLDWFYGYDWQATDINCYPAAVYLNSINEEYYEPFNGYFGTYNSTQFLNKVLFDIDQVEEPTLVDGLSASYNTNSQLPNYPSNMDIRHWIVIDGYKWDNMTQSVSEITFVDPAKSSAVSWSSTISAYSSTTVSNMFNFALGRGIIW